MLKRYEMTFNMEIQPDIYQKIRSIGPIRVSDFHPCLYEIEIDRTVWEEIFWTKNDVIVNDP